MPQNAPLSHDERVRLDTFFTDAPRLFHDAVGVADKTSVWRSRERTAEGDTLRDWTRAHIDLLRSLYHHSALLTDPRRPTVGCLLMYMGDE